MIIQNNIGWCDETINAVIGCDKVSAGCAHCYAEVGTYARVLRHREVNPIETWGPKGQRVPIKSFGPTLRRLNKLCICDKCHTASPWLKFYDGLGRCACGGELRRIRLFADSNSDWLDDKWPVETLANFLNEIRLAPNVDVQLLTKRAENWHDLLLKAWCLKGISDDPFDLWLQNWRVDKIAPNNVWLGVSVENQAMADLRIPQLLKIPAAVRFLSCEPLLESVDLDFWYDACEEEFGPYPGNKNPTNELHWVICGGESGPKRRDVPVEAIVSVHDQCKAAGVPCYVKQDSALFNGTQRRIPDAVWACKQFPGGAK